MAVTHAIARITMTLGCHGVGGITFCGKQWQDIPIRCNMDVEGIAVTSGVTPPLVILENMNARSSASEEKRKSPHENPRWPCAVLNIHHGLIYRIWKRDAARRIAVLEHVNRS